MFYMFDVRQDGVARSLEQILDLFVFSGEVRKSNTLLLKI